MHRNVFVPICLLIPWARTEKVHSLNKRNREISATITTQICTKHKTDELECCSLGLHNNKMTTTTTTLSNDFKEIRVCNKIRLHPHPAPRTYVCAHKRELHACARLVLADTCALCYHFYYHLTN